MAGAHAITTICYDSETQGFIHKSTVRELQSTEILIRTTHSGLCTTDVHAKEKGCGLGHEGVGIVEQVGVAVTNIRVAQRVGWGWLHSVKLHSLLRRPCSDVSLVVRALQDMCIRLPPILCRSSRLCLFGSRPGCSRRLPYYQLGICL